MPNTAKRALPYPASNVPADVPYWLQQLAEKLDTDLDALFADSGWNAVTPVTSGMSAGSDGIAYRRRSGYVFIQMHLVLNNGALRGTVFTLPAGYRPSRVFWTTAQSSGAPQAELKVAVDGTVSVSGTPNTSGNMVGYISFPVG